MIEGVKKAKASKLWFPMVIMFVLILNISSAEAKSLKKGEEFKGEHGGAIRVVSSDEVEINHGGADTFLGKYTIDGERVRVVINALGTAMVQYYKITPDGLIEEKTGNIYYSKARLAAVKEEMKRAEEEEKRWAALPEKITVTSPVLPKTIADFIGSRGLRMPRSIYKGCRFDFKTGGNPFFISGDFDGDERLDYAIDVEGKNMSKMFVFLANGQIHELGGEELIYTEKRGGTIMDVKLKYDAIVGVACEQSSRVYVYNKTKKSFDQLITGD